jgi:hypothetical protein
MLTGILDWTIGIVLCCSVITFLGIVAANASRPMSYVEPAAEADGERALRAGSAATISGRAAPAT